MAMPAFDPQKLREHLLSDYGVAPLLAKVKSDSEVIAWSWSCLANAVQASLCSLDSAAVALAERAYEWLRDESVRRLPGYKHHVGFALASWILTGQLDQRAISDACDYLCDYFPRVRDKIEVTHNLPTLLLAERYENICQAFEKTKGLTVPVAANRIRCPGKMSFFIATHELSEEVNRAVIKDALVSFLRYQIPVCLHVHRASLGTWNDVPIWMYLHGRYLQERPFFGIEALRVALNFVTVSEKQK